MFNNTLSEQSAFQPYFGLIFFSYCAAYVFLFTFIGMDLKKIFGTVLTLLGIGGLIYTAILFANDSGTTKMLLVYGVLGAIFFFSGVGLVRNTKEKS
ncbi:hypothetical protein LCGC14_0766670 [marine sediment metagenome]